MQDTVSNLPSGLGLVSEAAGPREIFRKSTLKCVTGGSRPAENDSYHHAIFTGMSFTWLTRI